MRLGVYGGAFDPPHNGHVAIARGAIEHFGLDRLVVLVSTRPGHKEVVTDPRIRHRLATVAFADVPEAEVELDPHAYTVEAVAGGRFCDVVFVIGADEFRDFLGWREPEKVLEEVRLGVGTRPGTRREELEAVRARLRRPERVEFFSIEPVEASSTEIRERVARGEPVDRLVPAGVARLIVDGRLYRAGDQLPSDRPVDFAAPARGHEET